MAKEILFGDEARKKIKVGIDIVAKAVKGTLGPKGRNVAFDRPSLDPLLTKDGYTVANQIMLEDGFENLGANLIKEASTKTNEKVGDGTSTSAVLAQALINAGIKKLDVNVSPIALRHGMEFGLDKLKHTIKAISKPITDKAGLKNVASISANDEQIGEHVANAMHKVGENGFVTIEHSQTFGMSEEYVNGFRFSKGYLSPLMAEPATLEASLEDPYILITENKLSAANDIIKAMDAVIINSEVKNLLVIADRTEGEALATAIINKLQGKLNTIVVDAPSYANNRKEILQDLATLTGATVINEESGIKLDGVELAHLGKCRSVKVTKDETLIVDGGGTKVGIKRRIQQVKTQIKNNDQKHHDEHLRMRLAKLLGGVGIIKIGAASDIEMVEKKHRVEDSLYATKASRDGGIVPGGGVALIRAAALLGTEFEDDRQIGIDILKAALLEPAKQIAENAGKSGDVVVNEIIKGKGDYGYNAATDKFQKLLAAGVIDPTKVVLSALENAVSIAGAFLTTETVIVDIPEEPKDNQPGQPVG